MKSYILTATAIVIVSLIGLMINIAIFTKEDSATFGSIQDGNAYTSTTTYNNVGAGTFGTSQVLKTGQGTLGSVVITGAVAGSLKFNDATSTTDVASTTIVTFPNSAAANTYTLDVAFTRGLIVQTISGLVPTTTITFR